MKKFKKLSREDQRNIQGGISGDVCPSGACSGNYQALGTDQCLTPSSVPGVECFGRLRNGICCIY